MRKPNQDPKDPHDYVQIGFSHDVEYHCSSIASGFRSISSSIKTMPIYRKVFVPCKYCLKYDSKVEYITTDGLKGVYHPHCASRVIHEATAELTKRMK